MPASLWVTKREQADSTQSAFPAPRSEETRWENDKDFGFCIPVARAEAGEFEKRVDEAFQEWIKFWKRVGGLTALPSA